MSRPRPLTRIEQQAADFREGLMQREGVTIGKISDAYRTVLAQIDRDLQQILRETEIAQQQGRPLSSLSFKRARLERLRDDAMRELARVGGEALDIVDAARLDAIKLGFDQANALVDTALERSGVAGVSAHIPAAGVPTGSVTSIVAATQKGSALRETLTKISASSASKAVDHLVNGVALGQNPRKIAAAMRKELAIPQWHAERIARTEVIRAHRAATLDRFQTFAALPTPLVEGWVWCASTGGCCVACLAKHGTKHTLDETLNGHPNCRCVMLPIRASAADLGYDDAPDILTGDELLASMIEDGDLDRFGPGVRDALESGKADLSDFVQVRTDPTWGSTVSQRSLRSVLGND